MILNEKRVRTGLVIEERRVLTGSLHTVQEVHKIFISICAIGYLKSWVHI